MKTGTERRGFIVLVSISIVLTVTTILFSVNIVNGANQRTCDILQIALLNPVPNPVGVNDTPLKEVLYHRYLAYVKLAQELKCQNSSPR